MRIWIAIALSATISLRRPGIWISTVEISVVPRHAKWNLSNAAGAEEGVFTKNPVDMTVDQP